MRDDEPKPTVGTQGNDCFRTTRWSIVLAAGDERRADSDDALAKLCCTYWIPVYAFIRRHVPRAADAQDLTQEFFARLLEKNYLSRADRQRGRFRTFLLTVVQRFLSKERNKAMAKKRGGGKKVLSLDFARGEYHCAWQAKDEATPEQEFDRQWARHLLETVTGRLRCEYAEAGKGGVFEELKPLMIRATDAADYSTAAERLGMSVGATRTAVYRMRKRYRELLRGEIAHTVCHPDDVDDELRWLFEALG